MAIRGAKPSLITAATNASHRELPNAQAAGGDVTFMAMPDDLSPGGKEIWQILLPPLFDARVLREEDILLLIEVCEAWALTTYFRKAMWAEIHGINDDTIVKRLRAGWSQSLSHARSLLGELGIGPVNRIRLGLGRGDAAGGLLGQLLAGLDSTEPLQHEQDQS